MLRYKPDVQKIKKLMADRAALLAALKTAVAIAPGEMLETTWGLAARAAIAKADKS